MKTLLVVMGIIVCGIGLLYLCGGGFYISMLQVALSGGMDSSAMTPEEEAQMEKFLPLVGSGMAALLMMILGFAGGLIWLGVGSIMARSWARKLLAALGWLVVAMAVTQTVAYFCILPAYVEMMNGLMSTIPSVTPPATPGGTAPPPPVATPAPPMPGGAFVAIQAVMTIIGGLMAAAPGVALIVIYNLRNVRLTCESLDPKPRWTDRVPAEVLPLWLLLVIWAFGILMPLPFVFTLPSFMSEGYNVFLVAGGMLIGSAFLGYLAWMVSTMKQIAWWIVMSAAVLYIFGTVFFISQIDVDFMWDIAIRFGATEEMRAEFDAEVPPQVVESIESMMFNWLPIAIIGGAFLGYLTWIRKFFISDEADPNLAPPQ